MKTIIVLTTYAIGIGQLALGVFFWFTNSKNEIRRVMAVLSLSTGLWTIINTFTAYRDHGAFLVLSNQMTYIFGLLLLTAFVHLTLVFPYRFFSFDRLHVLLLYLPAVIFSVIAVSSNTIVDSVSITGPNDPGRIVGGPLYSLYNIYLALLYLTGLIILLYRIRKMDGSHKSNAKIVFWSVALGGLLAVYLDLLAPVFGLPSINFLYGNVASIIWLGLTTYIVMKK